VDAFAVQSTDRQVLLNDAVAPKKTAGMFGMPFAIKRSMNAWEGRTARAAIKTTGRQKLRTNDFGNSTIER
jgi:hypothetical protein